MYELTIPKWRTAENEFARDNLYGWADSLVRHLRAERDRLAAENDRAMRVVRCADRRPALCQTRAFDRATRIALATGADLSRLDDAIAEIEQASFRELLPRFKRACRARIGGGMKKLSEDHVALMGATTNAVTRLRGLGFKLKAARHLNPDIAVLDEAEITIANCLDVLRIGMKNRAGKPRASLDLPCWSAPLRPPLRAVPVVGTALESAGAILDRMLAKGQPEMRR